jgi:hypothetical protein
VVCVKVDVDRQTDVAQAYQVSSMPRTVLIDPAGRIIGDQLGYLPAEVADALDRAASADFDAAVTRMLAGHQQKLRARRQRQEYGADGSEIAMTDPQEAPGFPPVPDEAPDRLRARLEEALRPPASLQIGLEGETVSLQADAEPARLVHPGQRTGRIDAEGAARVDSGWSGDAFVVQQKYVSGARRVQRYAVQDGALVVTLDFKDPYSGELALRSIYRRQQP